MSGKKALLELLKQQKDQETDGKTEKRQRLKEWLQAIEHLFQTIETWLRPAVVQNLLKVDRLSTTVSEWQLGDYEAPTLRITAPNRRHVDLVPKGRDIVGGLGRVDFESGPDRLVLIRTEPNNWQFTVRHGGRVEKTELSDESLSDCLRELFE